MIGALARAAQAFDAPAYAEAAESAAGFLLETMRDDAGRLLHRYRGGEAAIRAHLDDYAFLAFGLIELYETTFKVQWLEEALRLIEESVRHFGDDAQGAFFFTADDAEELLVRQKEFYDGALPSGNAVALLNLVRLARLTGRSELEDEAARLVGAASPQVRQQPTGHTAFLMGLDFALGPAYEVVITGPSGANDTRAFLRAVQDTYAPRAVVLFRPADQDTSRLSQIAPFTREQRPLEGHATAYVCQNFQCRAPTTDVEEMLDALGK